jgi:hypothetical protein
MGTPGRKRGPKPQVRPSKPGPKIGGGSLKQSGGQANILLDYTPRPQFIDYHNRTQRFACIVAHRRFGKTTGNIHELQKGALTCPNPNPRFAYIAPQLKQAKDVAWDMLKNAAAPLLKHGVTFNEAELRVDYPNGGRVRLYGADNPDSMRGIYLDGVTLDEYADMDPAMWRDVVRPALADRGGWATFIGTPKGRDAFWKIWRQALAAPEEWFSLILRASETGVLTAAEMEKLRRDQDDDAAYMREMECSFDVPSAMQFIAASIIHEAVTREVRPIGPRLLGVDVARAGADSNVILLRDGDVVEQDWIQRFKQADLMQTVGRVAEAVEKWRPDMVFVDGGGVGGGVIDRLRQLGFMNIIEVNSSAKALDADKFKNLRAEMYWKVRAWLKDRGKIPQDERLIDDLAAPNYKYDISNRLQLESKDDMKGRGIPSPDVSDALALTFAQSVGFGMGKARPQLMYYEDADPFAFVP